MDCSPFRSIHRWLCTLTPNCGQPSASSPLGSKQRLQSGWARGVCRISTKARSKEAQRKQVSGRAPLICRTCSNAASPSLHQKVNKAMPLRMVGPRRASPGAAWAQCGASAGQGRGGKSSPAQPASGVKQVIPLRPAGAGASLLPAGFHLRKQHWGRSRARAVRRPHRAGATALPQPGRPRGGRDSALPPLLTAAAVRRRRIPRPPRASAFTSGSGDARPATRLCLFPAHGPEVQLRTGQWTQSWGPGGSRPPDASGPGWPRSRRRARTLAGKHRRTLTRHTLAPACPRRRVETDVGFAQELEAREGSEPEPCNSPRSANTRLPLLKASRSPPTTHICHWRGRRRPRPRSSIAGQTELPVRAPELPEKLTWAQVKIAAVAQKWPGSSKEKRNRLLPKGEEFDSRGCCLPRFPLSLAPQKRPEGDRPDAGGQRASREPTSSCRKHSRVAC
ncbi:PREDICTED: uncharacterized protein LOC108533398 [Rhinopithecus bieti]|uniref:uncharacterized protein LOC108533398 n=1 Tax=Rhinopithecus bieti TaxID=61621 RepID=UPI00083BB0F4|nr:PREDICTED: uncharacterized protein LOC108533398 [Rhinopithecus bieti]